MHPSKPPKITSYGIVASAAPVVLVIRRGPSKLVQLLLWNLYDEGRRAVRDATLARATP